MDNNEITEFHSVTPDSLVHLFDEETSVSDVEFPQASAVSLYQGPQITSSPYWDENQLGTSSCVPHAIGTLMEIKLDTLKKQNRGTEHISRMFWYTQRSNKPGQGSAPYEIFSMAENKGWIPWTELPTPSTEAEANALIITDQMTSDGKVNADLYSVKVTPLAYTEQALINACMSGQPIVFTFCSSIAEWKQEYVDILDPNLIPKDAPVSHEQVIMPYGAFIKDGKTYFTTAESAHINGLDHHHFSWDFLSKRMFNPLIGTVAIVTHDYPAYEFGVNLCKVMSGTDVEYLQKALVADGVMETPSQWGYFGLITFNAVRAFQKKYNIPATGFVGQLARAKLNELCFKQK